MLHLPEHFASDIVCTMAFGILAILLVVAGYKLFDWLTPKLDFDDEIKKGNHSMAIVVGAFIIGLCIVVGQVVSAILGS
jgi:putative membrane protein